jgi:hypothetical protein
LALRLELLFQELIEALHCLHGVWLLPEFLFKNNPNEDFEHADLGEQD